MTLCQRLILLLILLMSSASSHAQIQTDQSGVSDEQLSSWIAQAESGDTVAAFRLGHHFSYASKPDPAQAEQYLLAAAESGHLGAQLHLGTLYYVAFDDSPRTQSTYDWWYKAAQQGDARAQYLLALLEHQNAVPELDPLRAFAWLLLAAEQALPEALTIRDEMARLLTPQQQHEALQLSRTLLIHEETEDPDTAGAQPAPRLVAVATEPPNNAAIEISSDSKNNAQDSTLMPGTGHYVQVAALMDETSASTARDQWLQRYGDQLPAGITPFINLSTRNNGRQVYRLQLGPFDDSRSANIECERLKSQGKDCFVGRL